MNFEQYLQYKHAQQYQGIDDDMPDDYDVWLENLDKQEMIEFADEFKKLK